MSVSNEMIKEIREIIC